ncbi:MAG: hypothetical protein QXG39_09030, partial [Candidatus Aenigmatarchaeota archaeon]
LFSFWKGVPKTHEDFLFFDRKVRYEAMAEISSCNQNVLSAMNIALSIGNEELFNSFRIVRKKLEKIGGLLEAAHELVTEKKSSARGLVFLDFILLSGCFALSEETRDLLEKTFENDVAKIHEITEKIDRHVRKIERLIHIRNTALNIPDKQFLRFLEAEENDVYETFRSLAILAYSEDEKRSFLRKGEHYKSLVSRSLYAAKILEEKFGPEIDFKTFYIEFRKMNPDIDVPPDELEKALRKLVDDQWLLNIIYSAEGSKTVWTKLDYGKILRLVKDNKNYENGVTLMELTHITGWSAEYVNSVLQGLEERGIARKGVEPDGTVKWYFPEAAKMET